MFRAEYGFEYDPVQGKWLQEIQDRKVEPIEQGPLSEDDKARKAEAQARLDCEAEDIRALKEEVDATYSQAKPDYEQAKRSL
jgi:hypothetical protein